MKTYAWTEGTRAGGLSAVVVGNEFARIRRAAGKLSPDLIVKAAKSKSNPLHGYFEWNDKVAGHKYRCEQAAYLIRHNTVVFEGKSAVPSYVSVRTIGAPPHSKREYVPVEVAMQDTDLRGQVFEEALSQIRAWRRRYSAIKEFSKLFKAIDSIARAA